MKPINEMTLLEIVEYMEEWHELDPISDIAFRLRELHDLTRWIPVEERLPERGDEDEHGNVSAYGRHGIDTGYIGPCDFEFEIEKHVTHWRRIDKP